MKFYANLIAICLFLFNFQETVATVLVKSPFTNHMVLQRNMKVNIWGTAASGEQVTLKFNGQQKSVITGSNNNWRIVLDPMVAGGPYTMTISGTNTISLSDIYVGEVWHCSGQSNMALTLNSTVWSGEFDADIASANYPKFRYMATTSGTGAWNLVSPSTAGTCSATGFFFGKELLKNLDCAVGLVISAVGATFVEQWFDPVAVTAFKGKINPNISPGNMYNQHVLPIVSYGIRGTVWIQGEQNVSKGFGTTDYGDRFSAVINGWRKVWGQGDFPFYYAQLSLNSYAIQTGPFPSSQLALVREAQRRTLKLSQTSMTVVIDISSNVANGASGWHYKNKREAGRRMSLAPQALLYGKSIEYSGPLFESCSTSGNNVIVQFSHAKGLSTNDGKMPAGFGVAGNNGIWYWVDKATINGTSIILSSAKVPKPVQVCYGWNDHPILNLFNSDNLPASPFLSDKILVTGLDDFNQESPSVNTVTVFPNPIAGNTIEIKVPDPTISGISVIVTNLTGEILISRDIYSQDSQNVILDVSSLPKGTFFVQTRFSQVMNTTKLIRQ